MARGLVIKQLEPALGVMRALTSSRSIPLSLSPLIIVVMRSVMRHITHSWETQQVQCHGRVTVTDRSHDLVTP